jgi:hypothetical protein
VTKGKPVEWPWDESDEPADWLHRDTEYALRAPGLTQEEREQLRSEAHALQSNGMSKDDVSALICRKVCRIIGAPADFSTWTPVGTLVIETESQSKAGKRSQAKRNAAIEQWRQRCAELRAKGMTPGETFDRAWAALNAIHKGAPLPGFENLPPLPGRDAGSRLSKRAFRKQLFPKNVD